MMKTKTYLFIFLAFLFRLAACNPGMIDEGEVGTAVPVEPTKSPTEIPVDPPVSLTEDLLKNMTYQGIYNEPITLTDGLYEGEPFVEDGASKPTVTLIPFTAFGDLNGDGVDDCLLYTSPSPRDPE